MLLKRLILPLFVVFALSAAIFVTIYVFADDVGRKELWTEAGKSMLHVIAAVLIGNIVLVIVRDFEQRRKEAIAQRDLLRADLTDGVAQFYSQAKGIRRRLRAKSTKTIETAVYEELLNDLNDVQLGLERYSRAAQIASKNKILADSVPKALRSMENYLNRLISEYEMVLANSEEGQISLEVLPEVRDFIGDYRASRFRTEFVNAYSEVNKGVGDVIQKNLPDIRRAS